METISRKNDEVRSNMMGTMPEGKLLLKMSVPLALSMLIQAFYNIVDSIFVSNLGENALTAVSLAYPMNMLMIAVAVGTGVGINSLLSRLLGASRHEEVNRAASNGLLLMLLSACVFVLFGLFLVRPFMEVYTQISEIQEMGTTYLSICSVYCVGMFLQIFCERVMQAQGKPIYSMMMQLLGAVLNIIFDPILIFGLMGFPKMGIAGAAVATVGAQIAAAAFSLFMVFSKRSDIRVTWKGMRPDKGLIRDIYAVGVPSIILQAVGTVMQLVMNGILIAFTETAVAVFGVYFKVQTIALLPLFGMTNAEMSIIAFNYGARKRKRMMRTWRISLIAAFCMEALAVLLMLLFPDEILSLFNASPEMLRIGRPAFTIMPLCLPIAAACISMSVVFQSIGNGMYSMLLSLARQLVVLCPVAWLLARITNDVAMVWWSFPIAETASLIICVFLFIHVYRVRIQTIEESMNVL